MLNKSRFRAIYRALAGKFAGTGVYGALLPHRESYNHQIVTLKGGKSSGHVLKGNTAWILREGLYRRALQAVGPMQTDGLWVLPVSDISPWKNGN